MPHYSNFNQVQELYQHDKEVCVIDIRWPLETVIKTILACQHIISSSLHGLIFAHSYKIPAGHVEFQAKLGGDGVKFLDYYASGQVNAPLEALLISQKIPTIELEQYAITSPQPNLDPLVTPLLNACPFRVREV